MPNPDALATTETPGLTGRAILGVTVGNMLEFYDFITYSFFAVQIGRTFFPNDSAFASLMLSLVTFGAGFLTRPIGAFVIGAYSDRVGRRPAMVLSLAMMGTAIIVLSLTPSYASIGLAAPVIVVIARMVQGFSLGGEIGPSTAYLMEASAPESRGLAVSWQLASQQIAATAGALVGAGLSTVMSDAALDAYGWRIAFLIGAAALPFGLWLRRSLPETLHLAEVGAPEAAPAGAGLRAYGRLMAIGLFILASGTIVTYVTEYMTTYAETTLHVATTLAFGVSVVSNAVGILGALLGGWLSDRYGRRPVMIWPQVAALLLTYPVFLWITETRGALALLGGFGFLALVGSLPYSAFLAGSAESLPKAMRGGTMAIVYAVAIASFGGTAQPIVTWLIHVTGSPLAPAWYLAAAAAAGLIAMLLMRETAPVVTGAARDVRRP